MHADGTNCHLRHAPVVTVGPGMITRVVHTQTDVETMVVTATRGF